jgi:hypothetical protein
MLSRAWARWQTTPGVMPRRCAVHVARTEKGYAIDVRYTVAAPPDRPQVRVLLDNRAWGEVVNQRRAQAGGVVSFSEPHFVLNAPGPQDGQLSWAYATDWPDDFGALLIPGLLPQVVPVPRPRPGQATVPAMRIAVNVEAHPEAPTLIGTPADIGGGESPDSDLLQAVLVRNPIEATPSGPGRILVTEAVRRRWPGILSTPLVDIVGRVRDRLVATFAWPPIPAIVLAESSELRANGDSGLTIKITKGAAASLAGDPEWVEVMMAESLASYWWGVGISGTNRATSGWLAALGNGIALDYAQTHLGPRTIAQLRAHYVALRDQGLIATVRGALRGELNAHRFATRVLAFGDRFSTDREQTWRQVAALARQLWGQVVVDPQAFRRLLSGTSA